MKKITLLILLGFSLLFGADIVGSWKLQTPSANTDPAMAEMLKRIDIYKNGTIKFINLGSSTKWHHGKNGYYFLMMDERVAIKPIDNNHVSIGIGSNKSRYLRIGKRPIKSKKVKQSSVKFKLNKVYRAKIKGDYAFILLSPKHMFYFLQTDKKSKISVKEIKSGKLNKPIKNGFSFSTDHTYTLKNGNPYIVFEGKIVKVLSPDKLKYRGNIYRIQN